MIVFLYFQHVKVACPALFKAIYLSPVKKNKKQNIFLPCIWICKHAYFTPKIGENTIKSLMSGSSALSSLCNVTEICVCVCGSVYAKLSQETSCYTSIVLCTWWSFSSGTYVIRGPTCDTIKPKQAIMDEKRENLNVIINGEWQTALLVRYTSSLQFDLQANLIRQQCFSRLR